MGLNFHNFIYLSILHWPLTVIEDNICVRFEVYQRVKFEAAEFMKCKWLYLGMYLELGDK